MAVTRIYQDQVHTEGSNIDDTRTPADHDANAVDIQDTIDFICSQIADITGEMAWETAPDATIAAIEARTFLNEKLAMRELHLLTDITVPATQNFKILSVAGSEVVTPNIKAIGSTTKGLITATHTGTFGTHALDEVAGGTTINPKNCLAVVDASSGDPILSAGRKVFALLQNESGATDGAAFTDTTPERAQVSFVRINATNDDLEAVPVADIENKVVNLAFADRQDLDTWVEQDFMRRATFVDVGAGAVSVTLDNAIDNQGATPATQVTNIRWQIADGVALDFEDPTGARDLLKIAPGAAGDEVEVNVDTLDVNVGAAGTIDFDNGVSVDTGGTPIRLGVVAGQIDATALKVASTGGVMEVEASGGSLVLDATGQTLQADASILDLDATDDSHVIMAANAAAAKTLLIAARNAGAGDGDLELEADDDILFETVRETTPLPLDDATAGAISALPGGPHASVSAAILHAINSGGVDLSFDIFVAGSNFAQGANIPGVTFDLTQFSVDMGVPATPGSPTVFLFLNGRLMRGAAASGTGDFFPGTTPGNGDIIVDFPRGVRSGSVITSIGLKQ